MRIAVLLALLTATASASPHADLRLRRLPSPRTLKMRVSQTSAPAPASAPASQGSPSASAAASSPSALVFETSRRTSSEEDTTAPLSDRVVARFDLGLAVDGARMSGYPTYDGVCPADLSGANGRCMCLDAAGDSVPCDSSFVGDRYSSVRTYGLGEGYFGTRGVGADSLSTYVATGFRLGKNAPAVAGAASPPLLSPYDRTTDFHTRAAWLETDGLFDGEYLGPLRARAGRMYVYGPAIVHVDGGMIAWEKDWLEVSTYSGARVPDYRVDDTDAEVLDRGRAVSGAEIRADLHRWAPIAISASNLHYIGHDHSVVQAQLEPRARIVIRSSTRFHDGALAEQRLVARARISDESTVTLDGQYQSEADWSYDYASLATQPVAGTTTQLDRAAARFLDLGPVRPRFLAALIAGTVLAQNVDLLARGAVALDVDRDRMDDETRLNPHLPEYIEGGAGIEVRLRRALALQVTFLARNNRLPAFVSSAQHRDPQGVPNDLPAPYILGEEYVVEASMGARYSAGARRFSATGELYGRQARWAEAYVDSANRPIGFTDRHGGGRFGLEAWVNPRVRLRAEYDLSTILELSPEVRGLKTLRMTLEGTY